MFLSIISPEERLFDSEVRSVSLPGTAGAFTVLPHHAPIISTLRKGEVVCRLADGSEQTFEIRSGVVEVSSDVVTVCVE